jgi:hypothetical protein
MYGRLPESELIMQWGHGWQTKTTYTPKLQQARTFGCARAAQVGPHLFVDGLLNRRRIFVLIFRGHKAIFGSELLPRCNIGRARF